jgi:hypothetical protein
MSEKQSKFFQNEKKFRVGKHYNTLRVKTPRWEGRVEQPDEVGTIIPNSEKYLGMYVSSEHYGYGDGGGRYDYFIDETGKKITHSLDYDGTTRYSETQLNYIINRTPYLKVFEEAGTNKNEGEINEHINHYILDGLLVKEICSFIPPIPEIN